MQALADAVHIADQKLAPVYNLFKAIGKWWDAQVERSAPIGIVMPVKQMHPPSVYAIKSALGCPSCSAINKRIYGKFALHCAQL